MFATRGSNLCALALAMLLAAFAVPAAAEEAIQSLHSDISLARDGTVHVEETIRVTAEGNGINHGIYRDISTTFEDAEGKVRHVGFSLRSITRDGKPEPYHTERHSDYLRIYAGDADVSLSPGEYTYVLVYDTDRQVRWFDGRPELNWNVTGNDWAFPILAASAHVVLPGNVPPVRWTAYTGRFGERGTDFAGSVASDGTLDLQTKRRLEPGEGLTFVAEIPADAVDMPDAAANARYFLLDNRNWIIAGIGFLLVLAYYLWAWNRVGRDPKGGTIIPLFHPPKGISPALASYIQSWGFGGSPWKAFTASALSLAVRGLLVFDQEGKDLAFERTDKPVEAGDTLAADEQTLLSWVEEKGGKAEINSANGKSVAAIADKFQRSVRTESGGRYFKRNLLQFAIGVVLSILVIVIVLAFGGLTDDELGILFGVLFVGVFISIFLVPIVASLFKARSAGALIVSLAALIIIVGFALFFVSGLFAAGGGSIVAALREHAFPFALVFAFPFLNGVFYYLLQAPTAEGRPVMDEIAGFRMYMETAESGRLNIEKAPEITSQRFEALLPFAVALGVERPWAGAFAAALARAYPNDPDPMSHYDARWRRGGSWSTSDFGRSISSSVAAASSAMQSSMPRSSSSSSGFSGGGSSGGGGGGRGGGGW